MSPAVPRPRRSGRGGRGRIDPRSGPPAHRRRPDHAPDGVVRVQRAEAAEPDGGDAASAPGVPAAQVRDALAHLHDPGHLQTHPLAALAGGPDRTGRGRALERALLEAVEALEPQDGKPGPKAVRRYQLLKRRYVDGLTPESVRAELLIGRSEDYRAHQQAPEAVASVLRERWAGDGRDGVVGPPRGEHAGASPPARPRAGPPSNLPAPLTSFVGRERELAEVRRLLGTTRLLTVTGPGGAGKTRLALRVAADLLGDYPDGVYLAELAPLADPALVPQTVALALGVREVASQPVLTTLLAHLGPRNLLLVLDNCEHLLDGAARLADALLRNCPQLRIAATSREPLGMAGETSWRLPSLASPDPDQPLPTEELLGYEAVRLFVERASAARPGFALTERN